MSSRTNGVIMVDKGDDVNPITRSTTEASNEAKNILSNGIMSNSLCDLFSPTGKEYAYTIVGHIMKVCCPNDWSKLRTSDYDYITDVLKSELYNACNIMHVRDYENNKSRINSHANTIITNIKNIWF